MTNNQSPYFRRGSVSQDLVENVVQQFVDLLVAGGVSVEMVKMATTRALANSVDLKSITTFTELGTVQRDCMEVMCAWRREIAFVDENGEPSPLSLGSGTKSFQALCRRAHCKNDSSIVLRALTDFGAISVGDDNMVVAETPTFLLGHANEGGRIAVDGVLKQLEGFLQVIHRNVCSVSGERKPRFERACTVSVAVELEAVFDRLVRTRGQEFIDSIDEWLERNAKRESAAGRYLELGAGVYFINLGEGAIRTMTG
jgi:hypothetical protein